MKGGGFACFYFHRPASLANQHVGGTHRISGDIPGPAGSLLAPGQKHALESSLADDLLTPLSATARGAFEEYLTQESREARFIKACDRLQLGVRLVGYERAGWRGLDEFWDGLDPELFAEFAPCQDLCAELLRSRQGVS